MQLSPFDAGKAREAISTYCARLTLPAGHRSHEIQIKTIGVNMSVAVISFIFGGLINSMKLLSKSQATLAFALFVLIELAIYAIGNYRSKRCMRNAPTDEEANRWLSEITTCIITTREEELFTRLISAYLHGKADDAQTLAREAMRSPALSNLAFVRKLRDSLQPDWR